MCEYIFFLKSKAYNSVLYLFCQMSTKTKWKRICDEIVVNMSRNKLKRLAFSEEQPWAGAIMSSEKKERIHTVFKHNE